jgi:hypothetical protein
MRTEKEIKGILELARRYGLSEWIAPLQWTLGADNLPSLRSDAITVMLEGWFIFGFIDARRAYHYYRGGISLCGKWNLVVPGNPENKEEAADAVQRVKTWAPQSGKFKRCMECERRLISLKQRLRADMHRT